MKKILLVDDEPLIALLFKSIIEGFGHEIVDVAHSGKEAIEKTYKLMPEVVFMDINMEHRTAGIDACKSIKEKYPEIKVYFLTAYSADTFSKELSDLKYDGYVEKMYFEDNVEKLLNEN